DKNKFASPVISGTEGKGGELFGKEEGLPGNIYAPNITPDHLGSWTDGELFRAITSGVSKDNTSLFPLMPYNNFGKMDKEDILSIISYIRTLKPIKNEIPKRELDFPLNFIVNSMPQNPNFQTIPKKSDSINYGKYLVNAASCFTCHTQMNKGEPIKDMDFAGGEKFKIKNYGTIFSSNISSDKETGIGNWTKESFIKRFKDYSPKNIKNNEFQTVMPWYNYTEMPEDEIGAIYDYLKTTKPIKNLIENRFISEKK
ncbi:MAG: c-type cytochrome, partial [Cyanobacteriota bacterium]